jgi:hypothetical protein
VHKIIKINNWKELVDEMAGFKNSQTLHPKYLFRGQVDSEWTLEPRFARIARKRGLDRTKALQLEREIVNKFSISACELLPLANTISLTLARFKSQDGSGLDFMGWFVVMQHYGAPTRAMDWSSSPWVALYFACCEQDGLDGALWIADFAKVMTLADTTLPNIGNFTQSMGQATAPDVLVPVTATNTNQRIESQQAKFLVCTNPLADHLPLLEKAGALVKIVITRELKPSVMCELAQMNISAKTLFPGIDGLGRSIIEYCNVWDTSSTVK